MGGVQKKHLLCTIIFMVAISYQNCAPMTANKGAFSSNGRELESYIFVQKVFNQHCVSCHSRAEATNGFVGLSNYEDIVLSGTISPGDPGSSPLYISIVSGAMPPTSSLSQSEIDTIRDWILDGALQHQSHEFSISSGDDIILKLPTNSAPLTGVIADPKIVLVRTLWRQVSGPSVATITNAASPTAQVSNLREGSYTFEFLVETEQEDIFTDTMNIQVLP